MSLRQRTNASRSQDGSVVSTQPGRRGNQAEAGAQHREIGHLGEQIQQPGVVWMPRPSGPVGCPAGLEYLTQVDQVLVKQQIELIEVFTQWEGCNKYRVLNSVGQQVYFAHEESNICERQCFRNNRSFAMHITDNFGREVITVYKEFRCCNCPWCAGWDCCAQRVTVEAPPGHVVGYVKQRPSCCAPNYAIMDADDNEVFQLVGPCIVGLGAGVPCNINFTLYCAADGVTEAGRIQKQWGNLMTELFTSAYNFGVSFPLDLDVKMKAVVIGATFLIDFMYFENQCQCGSKD